MNYKEILTMAIKNEVESYEFYKDAAVKVSDSMLKDTFEELAKEETSHKRLLEGYLANEGQKMSFVESADYKVSESVELQALSTSTMVIRLLCR